MANITKVYLLSVPLENDYKDTLYFANATAQHDYFAGQVVQSYTDFSYQRKDSVIRIPAQVDTIRNCNYVMYQNTAYSNKWFYAFITKMVYVDDGRTDLYIATDVIQTWMFDMTFKDSYIEREHVNDDTFGLHTIPEGLETGEFVCNEVINYRYANTTSFPRTITDATMMVIVLVSTLVIKYGEENGVTVPKIYLDSPVWNMTNSVPQGLNIIGIPVCEDCLPGLYVLKGMYDSAGRGEAINSMFLMPMQSTTAWIPYTLINGQQAELSGCWFYPADSTGVNNSIVNVDNPFQSSLQVALNSSLNGYTPKNNKTKIGDYNYFTITNNDGAVIAFKYEDFYSTPNFNFIGSFEMGGSFMCYPTNSKKTATSGVNGDGWTEGIPAGKFPQLSWTSDYYLNWQAQNGKYLETTAILGGINMGANIIGGMLTGGLGNFSAINQLASSASWIPSGANATGADMRRYGQTMDRISNLGNAGNPAGMLGAVTNYAQQVADIMHQKNVARMTPDQAKGNASTGTLAYAYNAVGKYTARKMSVKAEYAKCIDDYFSAFGYKVNRLGKPLVNHRQNYWYTKTVQANIDGNIPNEDMDAIKTIYNNGITFWKDPTKIKDYSVSNNIV